MKKIKGGEPINIYTQTSGDWNSTNNYKSYAVDLDVGINEYIFGRTTPTNQFIVSTGLVNDNQGIRMVGGKKDKEYKIINNNVYLYKKNGNKYVKTKDKTKNNSSYNGKMIFDKISNNYYIDIGENNYLPIIKYNTGEILVKNI